ncbi:T9SS C-terminal target domain-containing protein [bacterium]|nr:MAG: T9SS C-terminal target domain-containing protein [bacterium]
MKHFFFLRKIFQSLLITILFASIISAQTVKFGDNIGTKSNVLVSNGNTIKIEYTFGGYNTETIKINGKEYINISAPGMSQLMEKGYPQLPVFKKSVVIPDLPAMNVRVLESDYFESTTAPVMPSKGHFTRDIDPNSVPYIFADAYRTDALYPQKNVSLDEPYIVRDLRGCVVQFNPVQYNPVKNTLRIYRRMVVEVYPDNSKSSVNPFYRLFPLAKVDYDFAGIYRELFMNYGVGSTRYDSIPEPGRLLVIYASQYASAIMPFVQWKQSRGLTVLTADYPATTGSGSAAIKNYIQNLYNTPEKVTYIVLVGESDQIPTLLGLSESAPSDPCYVKLAGNDAYPDAFISRISCQTISNLNYVITKLIKYERDVQMGAPWYKQALGVASNEGAPTPDSLRANWLRDTLLLHGFSQVDKQYQSWWTIPGIQSSINSGKSLINYIGHGSRTSWGTINYGVSNIYQLTNGWMNPFIIDVACVNGNFTLAECMEEAWLRAGDTINPKGGIGAFGASTNASWVPPCDMQTHSNYLLAHQYRKTTGAICFFGIMSAMDIWGGSTGEGLKIMEQYNIIGDCTTLLTFGVPLGPAISHTPLPNTENLNGPYVVTAAITPANAPLIPGATKLFWTRASVFSDSITMNNTGGNTWTASIPGNSAPALYKYYIKTRDTMQRNAFAPGGAPVNYYSFIASSDTSKPVITHTAIGNTPKSQWPITVNATATDNIGIDSVWVKWYKNNTYNIKRFKLNSTGGNNYSAPFNSTQAEVVYGDTIYYRIFARDNSSAHNMDSTQLYNFAIINQTNFYIGNGTNSSNYPFTTYWMDGRTDMLYTASELAASGAGFGTVTKIGFNVITADPAPMNGFKIKFQNTSATTLNGFVSTGWTNCYDGVYTLPGIGWQMITLQTPFVWNGTSNLLIEICYNNSAYTQYSPVYSTAISGMTWGQYTDLPTGDGCIDLSTGSLQAYRPNIGLTITSVQAEEQQVGKLPTSFVLSQNYPNPFNPVTKINFDIPKQTFVAVRIYDILGREIKTLVNEMKQPGSYSVAFNASEFASGVYFYRLETPGFTDVKRMLLIK